MKALVLEAYNQLEYKDVPSPEPEPGEVLIRVKACAICGSDVHGVDGSTGRRIPPVIMGHEAAGVIAEVGPDADGWRVGDRVTFDSTIYCGKCFYCRQGLTDLCDHRRVMGVSCDEYRQHGAFAEFVAVPQHILYRLPEELGFAQAALLEPLSVALHAVERAPKVLNQTAVVLGAGTIGLLIVQMLRAAGCAKIIALDIDPARVEIARWVGADVTLRPDKDDVLGEVSRLTPHGGADVAFEAVGIAETVRLAVMSLRKGGAVTLVGNLASDVDVPLQVIVTRELSLHGSTATRAKYPDTRDMLVRGVVDVDPLISATAPLADGAAWFERLRVGEPGLLKVVLIP